MEPTSRARRASAPALSEDAQLDADSAFSPDSCRRTWTLTGGGETIYEFFLGENVELMAYEHFAHLVIIARDAAVEPFREADSPILEAADPSRRGALFYRDAAGFEEGAGCWEGGDWVQERAQLAVEVHSVDTWHTGATDQPTLFYLDAEALSPLTAGRSVPRESGGRDDFALAIPIGLHYQPAGRNAQSLDLVLFPGGAKGARDVERQCIWEAGPGFDEALDMAEGILGYRPGDADFLGKASVRATLAWSGEGSSIRKKSATDADALGELDALLNAADLGRGGYNCPSPCFLTMEYADGSTASLAVAVNSFDYFFYRDRGLGIRTNADILGIFGLGCEDF